MWTLLFVSGNANRPTRICRRADGRQNDTDVWSVCLVVSFPVHDRQTRRAHHVASNILNVVPPPYFKSRPSISCIVRAPVTGSRKIIVHTLRCQRASLYVSARTRLIFVVFIYFFLYYYVIGESVGLN